MRLVILLALCPLWTASLFFLLLNFGHILVSCLLAYGSLIKHYVLSLVHSITHSSFPSHTVVWVINLFWDAWNLMDFKYVLCSWCCFLGPNASRVTLRFAFRFLCVYLFGGSVFWCNTVNCYGYRVFLIGTMNNTRLSQILQGIATNHPGLQ